MLQKVLKTTGWVLTIILALFFAVSAYLKLSENATAVLQATTFGLSLSTYKFLAVIEIISLILFVIPRTGVLGSLLLVAYLGGAIATHLEHGEPIATAVIFQILLWITITIRFPELWQRLLQSPKLSKGQ
jgi:hypothetical protein